MRIGVYVCECGINIAATVDVEKVAEHAKKLPYVVASRYYKYMCSDPGQELIKKDIKELKLDRVVVASCSPRMHEPTFRTAIVEADLNEYCLEMVNIREQCSWVHKNRDEATEKAKSLVQSAVFKVGLLKPLEKKTVDVTPTALVVGGGIAGIQAALDIGNMGFKTYLVEKTPSIGGRMAQLDKTFPTMDCSACILTPKMVDVARHCNVELLTYSEIESVEGYVGNFKVKVRKKPRYIDVDKCTGCGECFNGCPVEMPNEFDEGQGTRHAIYTPFPQAVPLKATIDKRGMHPCRDACPAGVGAPGYVTLVGRGKFYEALRVIKKRLPFPSICGRICHRPCENVCTRADLDDPIQIAHIKRFVGDLELKIPAIEIPPIETRAEKIAIIGGGPAGLTCAHDLALKGYHVSIFEAAPVLGGMMRFGIPAFRLPKEILEREISDILALGVQVHLNTALGKDLTMQDLFNRGFKSIFLSVGAQKGKKMNIPGEDLNGVFQAIDFLKEINLGRVITSSLVEINEDLCLACGKCAEVCYYGVIKTKTDEKNPKKQTPQIYKKYLCRGCGKCASVCPSKAIKLSGFRDIAPKIGKKVLVIGGGNAALDTARSAIRLGANDVSILYRRTREEMPAEPDWEIDETEKEGVKLEYLVAPTKVIGSKEGHVKEVECIRMQLLDEKDSSGRRKIKPIPGSEFKIKTDSIILAIGQEVDTGFLSKEIDLEMTNWSSKKVDPVAFPKSGFDDLKLTKWDTINSDPVTLETNIKGVFSGGDAVWGAGTVIEAIGAGKEAAISIDRYINDKDLREDREEKPEIAKPSVEGLKKKHMVPMKYLPVKERVKNFKEVELGYSEEEAIEEARRCLNCGGCSECYECVNTCEAGAICHDMKEEIVELDVGAIVVATGFDLYDPTQKLEYAYGKSKNVITGLEFERLVSASGPTEGHIELNGKEPKKVVFIQCVGSRDKEGNEYCSRVCCMYTAKQAHMVRDKIPDSDLTIYYTDVRAFGKGFEEFYNRVKGENINYRRRELDDPIKVEQKDAKAVVKAKGHPDIEADLVVLAAGLVPRNDSKELARILNINQSADGFYLEAHPKLRPVDTFTDGIFLAGCCQSPKDVPDTVAQASGAASRASDILSKKKLEIEATIATVNEDLCRGCGFCVEVCPYKAIELVEKDRFGHKVLVAQVNEALCKGCGSCAAACLNQAIGHLGFTDGQILSMIKALGKD
jgi:heterodisulfide reductase subunit A-like polyferredoxin